LLIVLFVFYVSSEKIQAIKNTEAIIVLIFNPFLFPLLRQKGMQKYNLFSDNKKLHLN